MRRPRAAATTDHAAGADGSRRVWAALAEQQVRLKTRAARLSATRAKDVHDARVAARRLRSLLATYRPLIDGRRSRVLRRQLRDFARALSEVREADVRQDLLLALTKHGPGLEAADAGRLRVMLRWSCAEARRALRGAVTTQDWAALVALLGDERTLAALRLRGDAGLGEVLELVDRPWRDAGKLLDPPPRSAAKLHRLRLALKRCRYALESVASLEPDQAEKALDRLRAAQDRLGEHRDTVQARAWVRANHERLGPPLARHLEQALRRHERALKDEAIERGARVMPAYHEWRQATRGFSSASETTPGPA